MGRSKKTNSGSSKLSIEVLCGSMPGRARLLATWSSNTAKSQNPSHLAIFQDHVCRFPKDQRRSERTCPHKQDTIIPDSLCEPKRHGVHLRSFHGMPFISHSCSKKYIPLEGYLQTKKCERASTMEFKAHGTHSPWPLWFRSMAAPWPPGPSPGPSPSTAGCPWRPGRCSRSRGSTRPPQLERLRAPSRASDEPSRASGASEPKAPS